MIKGNWERAIIRCDAAGCRASLEANNTRDSVTSALQTLMDLAGNHYGWTLDGGHYCPEHPPGLVSA